MTSDPLRAVFEKYKHRDHLLSDEKLECGDFRFYILKDLWLAIKAAQGQSKP